MLLAAWQRSGIERRTEDHPIHIKSCVADSPQKQVERV